MAAGTKVELVENGYRIYGYIMGPSSKEPGKFEINCAGVIFHRSPDEMKEVLGG
jgi:hypothetical protein